MPIETLLLTRDVHLHQVLQRALDGYGIEAEHHTSGTQALLRVSDWRFSAVIADCDHEAGLSLLKASRTISRNTNGIVIAAVPAGVGVQLPFRAGANFMLEKPVSRAATDRLVRAAYGLIAREHLRYVRRSVEVIVRTEMASGECILLRSRNLSARGLGLQSMSLTPRRGPVRVHFNLFPAQEAVEAQGEVVWTDDAGRAGLRLLKMSRDSRRMLDCWLDSHSDALCTRAPAHLLVPRHEIPAAYAS
jgi:CheY-like chemotaxis protein